MKGWTIWVVVAVLSAVVPGEVAGQEAASAPVVGDVSLEGIPEAFLKPAPTSVADLAAMEEHVTRLVPRLKACTVNLKIGRAQGSGVIVSPAGYIMTAAHVSGPPGRSVSIVTSDGRRYGGKTLGRNRTLDASLVRIESNRKDWPYCPLSKEDLEPGDWCAVTGHPGGYQPERGVVFRLGRVILKNSWLVQTDCELVGGDSGGPLFNMRGEVIGINTRIGESTEYNFHVPVDVYHRDWKRLVAGEDFRTHSGAYLGVAGTPRTNGQGLVLEKVFPGDPADRAGIQQGDILLTFQGEPVNSLQKLIELVGEEFPGKRVTLSLLREGEPVEVRMHLGMRWD